MTINILQANFYRAVQFCRQMGMQLVSITNLAENNRLGKFVEEIGKFFTNFAELKKITYCNNQRTQSYDQLRENMIFLYIIFVW